MSLAAAEAYETYLALYSTGEDSHIAGIRWKDTYMYKAVRAEKFISIIDTYRQKVPD